MPSDFLISLHNNQTAYACMDYNMTLTKCGGITACATEYGGLYAPELKPGCVSGGCIEPCAVADFTLTRCQTAQPLSIAAEPEPVYCGTGGETIVTCTDFTAAPLDCERDMVCFTVSFTNRSDTKFDSVRVFVSVPPGVKVIYDTIKPVPLPGESLRTGVTIGAAGSGQTVTLAYKAVIEPCAGSCVTSGARVEYEYYDNCGCAHIGVGSECLCTAQIETVCFCETVTECVEIDEFLSVCGCYAYHTGAKRFCTGSGEAVIAGYGVTVKYVDSEGKKRSCDSEGSVVFNLPRGTVLHRPAVRFSCLNYTIAPDGRFVVTVDVMLST